MKKNVFCSHVKDFMLWIFGIFLAMVPTVLKHFNILLNTNEDYDFINKSICDSDVLFVVFSTGALLLLEMIIREQFDNIRWMKIIVMVASVSAFVLYIISVFSPGWETHFPDSNMKRINCMSLLLVIIFGIIYFVISYNEIKKEKPNNNFIKGVEEFFNA